MEIRYDDSIEAIHESDLVASGNAASVKPGTYDLRLAFVQRLLAYQPDRADNDDSTPALKG